MRGTVAGDLGSWEALVDAGSGELLAFEDRNQYIKRMPVTHGGVFPISNDGQAPGGTELAQWPMPFADLTSGEGVRTFANSGGIGVCVDDTAKIRTRLQGQFARISDNCGAIQEKGSETLILNLAQSGGTDCTIPPNHSAVRLCTSELLSCADTSAST